MQHGSGGSRSEKHSVAEHETGARLDVQHVGLNSLAIVWRGKRLKANVQRMINRGKKH